MPHSRLTVRWFGEPPLAVRQVLDSADAGLEVVVQRTEFRPGDLRAEAERLRRDHAPTVTGASTRPEGNGIEVLVHPDAAETAGSGEAAAVERGVTSEHPLFFEVGSPA